MTKHFLIILVALLWCNVGVAGQQQLINQHLENRKLEPIEGALRAIQLCQPLKVPTSGYERWKNLQLNFDAREMLGG